MKVFQLSFLIAATCLSLVGFSQTPNFALRADDATLRFELRETAQAIDVLQSDQLVTTYRFQSGSKPILWPLMGPDQIRMTREYPMNPNSVGEEHDHVHHRSLWMTFGDVDGVDYWGEGEGKGTIVHRRVLESKATHTSASIVAEHHWIPPQSSTPKLVEYCNYRFSGTPDERIIDCEFLLQHPDRSLETNPAPSAPIHFGDTKEGMFGIRVPETMRSDRTSGSILNSSGEKNGDAWGRPARWVDYAGSAIDIHTAKPTDRDYGILVMVHPTSFRNQGFWHVRTYGLFAHNPFGVKDFVEGRKMSVDNRADENKLTGGFDLKQPEAIHLFYRVVLHRDRWSIERAQSKFVEFESARPSLNSLISNPR